MNRFCSECERRLGKSIAESPAYCPEHPEALVAVSPGENLSDVEEPLPPSCLDEEPPDSAYDVDRLMLTEAAEHVHQLERELQMLRDLARHADGKLAEFQRAIADYANRRTQSHPGHTLIDEARMALTKAQEKL